MSGRFGIVSIASADLRRHPRHAAELRSQLLLGEVVRLSAGRPQAGWVKAEGLHDGYRGWLRAWSFLPVSESEARRWLRRATLRVGVPIEPLRSVEDPREPLMPAFLGARLAPARGATGRGRRITVVLPDGRRGTLPATAVAPARVAKVALRARLRSLMGVPYLWGGRTPAGFDCSGLTQIVLAEQGVAIPRDAKDQFRATRRLARGETPREGDLVFFARPGEAVSHVGLTLDRGTFVHCRGFVRLASLDPDNPLCDKDLLPQVRGFGRP